MRASNFIWTTVLAVGLSACSGLPSAPSQPARYDLGPLPHTAAPAAVNVPVLALADIQARAQNENSTSMLYRLAYADTHVQHAYAYARWSQPPAVLVQQRLRDILGQRRTVLSAEGGAQAPSVQGRNVPVLQLALEQFEHLFTSSSASVGALQLRATLVDPRRGGDVLLGQQVWVLQQPANAANAAAGAQALASAVDQAGLQLLQWLNQLPAAAP